MRKFALAVLTVLTLVACFRSTPPAGRWEGVDETNDTMIAARLEIGSDGQAKISAPDLLDIGNASDEERAAMRQKLAGDLAAGWGDVVPRKLDFDGETFRKPGGIAPQMIWKEKSKQMFLVVYLGTQPSIRIAMKSVGDFSDDPWTH